MSEDRMLKLFRFQDVGPEVKTKVQLVRDVYEAMAVRIVDMIPAGPERTVALRHLLDSKDCAVRGLLFDEAAPKVGTFTTTHSSGA